MFSLKLKYLNAVKSSNFFLLVGYSILLHLAFHLIFINHKNFADVTGKIQLVPDIDTTRLFISCIAQLLIFNLISRSKQRDFVYAVLNLLVVFLFIPSAVFFSFTNQVNPGIFICHSGLILSVFLVSKVRIPLKDYSVDIKVTRQLILLLSIIAIIPLLKYLPYIDLKNLLLQNVYQTRAVFREVSGVYLKYSYSWLNNFIIPSLFIFCLYQKKVFTALASFIVLIFLFLLGAHKSVLFGTILVFLFYWFSYEKIITILLTALSIITLISLFSYFFLDSQKIFNYSIRRAIFVPSLLDLAYFDFYETLNLFWSESVINPFMDNPFEKTHSYVIAEEYFKKSDMSANNGIISDGFLNFGYIGVGINIVLFSVIISLINQWDISSKFFGLVLLFTRAIVGSSFTTVMITHGGLIFLVMCFFFLRNTNKKMAL